MAGRDRPKPQAETSKHAQISRVRGTARSKIEVMAGVCPVWGWFAEEHAGG
jgi:hypothetical protein